MRKAFGTLVAIVVLIVILLACGGRPQKPQYVFLICFDATRPDHLSCYGYNVKTTPRLDQLAAQGAVFDDAVSQAPWTTASVATILSSTFPCQHGIKRNEGSEQPYAGPSTNFVEKLASRGFETGLFTGGIAIKGKIPSADLISGVLGWLKRNKTKPCLAVIHNYETHSPYTASAECIDALDPGYTGPYKLRFGDIDLLKQARVGRLGDVLHLTDADVKHIKALYDCQIMDADRALGTLVDSLGAWGLLKRSMIIVFADHGEEFFEHGSFEHGQTVYEESIRVPLVIYCPALVSRPKRVAQQVGLIDLAPTIFDALGVPKLPEFEGRSLAPLVSSRFKAPSDSTRPCGLPANCLVAESIARRSEKKALRCPPWKLIFDPFYGAVELYNLAKDPHETTNLIDVEPQVAARLTKTLLVMEKYYPGGWCLAWRDAAGGKTSGSVKVDGGLLEAVAHDFLPEIDTRTDTLVTSEDRSTVHFATGASEAWRGIELRMAEPSRATCAVGRGGRSPVASAGSRTGVSCLNLASLARGKGELATFPITVAPDSARVERRDLHNLFLRLDSTRAESGGGAGNSWQCILYWLQPGSEPMAKSAKDRELKKELKAIGYIE